MKVTRKQVEKHRKRILDRAGELFREKGFDGVSVADIMKAAGLTHGAFYGHFSSKDQLIAEACANAFSVSRDNWNNDAAKHPRNPLAAIVALYLSTKHRDDLANGCLFAALGSDTVRQDKPVRRAFTDGLRAQIAILTKIAAGASEKMRREKAIAAMAGLVGALILARAVDDQAFSNEILKVAAARLSR
jgi:TetR/AcrR family transcriptional regulator, transcriptional repressor for nem operon